MPNVLVGTIVGFTMSRMGYSDGACIAAMAASQAVVVLLMFRFCPR
jgi:hypothetical protein